MIHDLLFRARAVFRRRAMEAELDEELRAHLEHQAEKHMRSGLSREEAEGRARLDFGDLDQMKDECRSSWGVRLIDDAAAEVRAVLRQARRKPVFATASALALVLGLLANTMMFDGLTSMIGRFSPHQQPAGPVLAAQNSMPPPPPVNKSGARPRPAVRKVPSKKLSHARLSRRPTESPPERLASASGERVTIEKAAFLCMPGAGRFEAAKSVYYAGSNRIHFVLISRTWSHARHEAALEELEMTIHSGDLSYTVVEVISSNPENPQQESWRPLVLNARAAMSNSAQRRALARTEQSGQCTSASESLSHL